MSRTILADVEGWTPIIDSVKEAVGLHGALVFGCVWRYCQMEDGKCTASLQKIADRLGIDRSTVIRQVRALVEKGFLKDLTPDERQKPHEYADTGKAGLRASIYGVAQNDSGVAESTTRGGREQLGESQRTTRGVAENHPKIDLKKELREEEEIPSSPSAEEHPPTPEWLEAVDFFRQALFKIEAEVSKATFDTWIRDARLVSFDGEVFVIGTLNGYARDWLTDRVASTMRRILTGIVGRPVDVRFVVAKPVRTGEPERGMEVAR